MGRGDGFLKALSVLLVLSLAAYLGVWAFGALETGLSTVEAVEAVVTLGGELEGIIVRDEVLLQSEAKIGEILAAEGKRLGVGDAVAEGIFAEYAGLFTASVDGFESLSPGALDTLSSTGLSELLESGGEAAEKAFGKTVRGTSWYFAAFTDEKLYAGQRVTLDFGFAVEAEVVRASGGLAVFRMESHLAEILGLRKAEAELVTAEYSGIRIPAAVLRQREDGETYVTVLTATLPEDKTVNIIHDGGDWLLVETEDRADALRPGNLIVTDP